MIINELIGETTEYEKKVALETKKPKSWCKTISAFANGRGGKLFFGVDDNDNIVGLTNMKKDSEDISEIIKTHLNPIPQFDMNFNNQGVMSIFISLITVLNMVNDTYTIYDLGNHVYVRKYIMERYKSFGIKELNYEPTNFDRGAPKFVWVRQKYSATYYMTSKIQKVQKEKHFSLFKFYGK